MLLENQLGTLGKQIVFDKESWTLELGSGMQMNPESVDKGVQGIKNYLAEKGVLSIPDFPLPQTASHRVTFIPKSTIKKYYAPSGGMIQLRVKLGTLIEAGERLYQILSFNKEEKLPKLIDVCAENAGLVFDISTNHAVNEGEYVLSVM
ncbi:succinylglutamate desuccinylase/aspartoacylase family protein [Coleofasciculus sp. H7-2]|uniref:succinylglutamate desuccinylase/aspartoacylase family protein n=1 Tax=Coleofasciculus sp. H7-2 TaxID=3351545 RepID=UPI00366CFA3D